MFVFQHVVILAIHTMTLMQSAMQVVLKVAFAKEAMFVDKMDHAFCPEIAQVRTVYIFNIIAFLLNSQS